MATLTMHTVKHFIWDFDGTLFDTYPIIIENLRLALQEFGFDCEPAAAMSHLTENVLATRDYYADKFGIDRETLYEAYLRHREKAVPLYRGKPMADVQAVLEKIRATGRQSYIFTHRKGEETEIYLKKYGLDGYFTEIVGADAPCFAWKPAPDALRYLVDKYQMAGAETVMIGDRECDLGSGRNAGIQTAHLVCAIAPEQLDCTWRLENYRQMLQLL